jgi:predicted metal-dependent hydrolase
VASKRDSHDVVYEDRVVSGGVAIRYHFCRSRRRSLGVTVRPDKSVSVRVPLRTPLPVIREFVERRGAWIQKIWAELDRKGQTPPQSYRSGAIFMFLGREYRLAVEEGPRKSVRLRGGCLVVTAPERPSQEHRAELVDAWYRKRAASLFQKRLALYHELVHPTRTTLPSLTIRPMSSRWGSYSYRTRRVTLNLQLIRLPLAYLDYVIIHELCHITVRHHGPGFWRHVERFLPDHAELRRQLREFSPSPL